VFWQINNNDDGNDDNRSLSTLQLIETATRQLGLFGAFCMASNQLGAGA